MKILITNYVLKSYTGTEVVVRDLSRELKKKGHQVWVYSPTLGKIADEIRDAGIPVYDDLRNLESPPDIVHGHHHAQTLTALLRFRDAKAVLVCHDANAWQDEPVTFPRIVRYVAVDYRCKRRFDSNPKIPTEMVRVIPNAVDMSRFRPRSSLPREPLRAAIFSNYGSKWNYAPTLQDACKRAGIQLDLIGARFDTSTPCPELLLPKYDLVFAKARCALEAMTVGCAVVLCDAPGLGVMVTSTNVADLRRLNFGGGTLTRPIQADLVAAEIEKYDPKDADTVAQRMRSEAALSDAACDWIAVYEEAINDPAAHTREDELAAIAEYLERWGYGNRVAWEIEKARPFTDLPLVGPWLKRQLRKLQ